MPRARGTRAVRGRSARGTKPQSPGSPVLREEVERHPRPAVLEQPEAPGRVALRPECLEHTAVLYDAALRMARNPDDAADLVQETYLKAVRSAHLYRESPSCRPWLMRILLHAYVDRYRRNRRRPDEVAYEDEGEWVADQLFAGSRGGAEWRDQVPDGDLEAFLFEAVGDEVKTALDELPESFRVAVVLRDVEGLSYGEIAERLGIPEGTAMSRVFRGHRILRRRLTSYARGLGVLSRTPTPSGLAEPLVSS